MFLRNMKLKKSSLREKPFFKLPGQSMPDKVETPSRDVTDEINDVVRSISAGINSKK